MAGSSRALIVTAFATGCFGGSCTEVLAGNEALGIAELRIIENAERTTILAFDSHEVQIGKLELVHGRFVSTDSTASYLGQEVDGRKLDVEFEGQGLQWETRGYADAS